MDLSTRQLRADDSPSLRVIVATLVEMRWWIGVTVLVVTASFTAAAFLMKPIYRASTVLIPVSMEEMSLGNAMGSAVGQLSGLASLAGITLGGSDSSIEEALAVLRSCDFTAAFITEYDLMPKLFEKKWNAKIGAWKVRVKKRPTIPKACDYFARKVRTLTRDKRTGLVLLQIDWKDRNEAALWANIMVGRLNAEMRNRAIEHANASLTYLEKELAATKVVETRQAINRLIEGQIQRRMLANVTEEYAFRVVDSAMPPDVDDPVRPKKKLFVAIGLLLGLLAGVASALAYSTVSRTWRQ